MNNTRRLLHRLLPPRRLRQLRGSTPIRENCRDRVCCPLISLSVLVPRLYSTDLEFVMLDVEPKTEVLLQAGVLPRDILFQPYAAITQRLMDDLSRQYA
jgi:hypothetical protein